MALFSDKDFEELRLDVFAKDFSKNPLVKQIFGEQVSSSDLTIIKYIVLLYDVKSPLRLKIPDIINRKEECAEMVGLKSGREELFDLSHPKVLGYINMYLRYQSSKVWSVLAANEEVLWQYQQELLTPIQNFKSDKDKLQALEIKTKLMQECDAIIKRIDAYEEKLFGDNKEKKDQILTMTPESIANV
jgi:hypothetical protein